VLFYFHHESAAVFDRIKGDVSGFAAVSKLFYFIVAACAVGNNCFWDEEFVHVPNVEA
jgi:hypothetical protein